MADEQQDEKAGSAAQRPDVGTGQRKEQQTGAGQEATNDAPRDHPREHQSNYGGGGANGGSNGGAGGNANK